MNNMDAYTILYQAKNYITEERDIKQLLDENVGVSIDQILEAPERYTEEIRLFTLKCLEDSIKGFRHEFPPNVCTRMEKYYVQNKDTLADVFYNKVKEMLSLA
ncbi:MAG: hypothetical protein ACRCTE_02165 [Cellulosilyticaceae bacterium]